MPIYLFFCPECKKEIELTLNYEDLNKPIKCGKCGSELEKLVTAPSSFNFKGSGFYENDYKKKK